MRAPRALRASATLIALGAALGAAGCPESGGRPAGRVRPPPLVAVAKVETRDVPVELRAPVDLRPIEQAEVGSKTLGYLDAVLVDRGDPVRRGQLLALVRPSDLPDQLAAARGTLASASAAASLARTTAERAEALAPQKVISQQDLQQAQSTLASAVAAEEGARAQIAALAVRIGETKITSPLTGYVAVRRVDPGTLVGPAIGPIVTVVRLDTLRVFVAVNERDATRVKVGQQAHVELDALDGKSILGKVVRVSPALDPATRTLDAEVHLPNPTGELKAGMYGRGSIVLDVHRGALVAPVGAIVQSDGKAYAFVLEGEVVHRREVKLGVDGGDFFEITAGLAEGDELVVAGLEGLSEGAKVRAFRGRAEQAAAPAADAGRAKAAATARTL